MAQAVEHSELTARRARIGSFEDQRRSTWDKLGEAIAAHHEEAALELAEFALDGECRFIFDLLTGWADDLRRLLGERGVPEEELRAHTERLARLLAFPDGEPYDASAGWEAVARAVGRVTDPVRGGGGMPPPPLSARRVRPGAGFTIGSSTPATPG